MKNLFTIIFISLFSISSYALNMSLDGPTSNCVGGTWVAEYSGSFSNGWCDDSPVSITYSVIGGTITHVYNGSQWLVYSPLFPPLLNGKDTKVRVSWPSNNCGEVFILGIGPSGIFCSQNADTASLKVTNGTPKAVSKIIVNPSGPNDQDGTGVILGCESNTFRAFIGGSDCVTEFHWNIDGQNFTTASNEITLDTECGTVQVAASNECGVGPWSSESFGCSVTNPLTLPLTNVVACNGGCGTFIVPPDLNINVTESYLWEFVGSNNAAYLTNSYGSGTVFGLDFFQVCSDNLMEGNNSSWLIIKFEYCGRSFTSIIFFTFVDCLKQPKVDVLSIIIDEEQFQELTSFDSNLDIDSEEFIQEVLKISKYSVSTQNSSDFVETRNSQMEQMDMELKLDFKVFPNPTSDLLNIEVDNLDEYSYQLITVTNQVVMSQDKLSGKTQVNIQDLPEGTYFVRILQGKKMKTQKVIKL